MGKKKQIDLVGEKEQEWADIHLFALNALEKKAKGGKTIETTRIQIAGSEENLIRESSIILCHLTTDSCRNPSIVYLLWGRFWVIRLETPSLSHSI